jgi:dCTP diphosphatase
VDWTQFYSSNNLSVLLVIELMNLQMSSLCSRKREIQVAWKLASAEDEIEDMMVYLPTIADKLGIDPVEATAHELEINEKKYPVEKARGSADKYTEL